MTTSYGAAATPADQATAVDNTCRWDGAKRGHYEVWFLAISHLATRTGIWLRYTLEAPLDNVGEPYAALWFAVSEAAEPGRGFAVHQRLPISRLAREAQPFALRLGDAELGHGHARGALEGDGHRARWDLAWLPHPRTLRWFPALAYRATFADTLVLSPNVDVPVRGTIEIDGRTLTFDGDPASQTHLWGRKHAHAWAWGHCNAFEGRRGAVLEAVSPRLKRRGLVLPSLTMATLWLDGEDLRFNDFQDTLFARARFGTAHYHFRATGRTARIQADFTCRPDDMILTPYEDPDGEPAFCANTSVGDLHLTVWRRSGWLGRWREDVVLRADKTAHFEVAGREPDPLIRRRHVAI